MTRATTHEQYKNRLRILQGGNIKILDEYKSMKGRNNFKCKVCKHSWSTIAEALVRKTKITGCPKCNGGTGLDKKTDKDYKKEVHTISEGTVRVIDKYIDNTTRIKHECLVCDEVYLCTPTRVSCPRCRIEKQRKTKEKYIEEIGKIFKGDIEIVGNYKSSRTKTQHKCNNCSTLWDAWPTHVLKGVGCPNCCTGGNPYKNFELGNRIVQVQGHENVVLKELLKSYKAKDIRVFSEGCVPKIRYNKTKNHYPDIFIPAKNILIEVKGNASLGMIQYHNTKTKEARIKLFRTVQNKAKAAIKQGYVYKLFLVQPNHKIKELPENWQHLSYSRFRKLWLEIKRL